MRNAIAIAKKELNIYFATPIAYVMFTLFVVIGSYFFLRLLGAYEQASLMYMRFNAGEMANRLNFQDAIFRNLFGKDRKSTRLNSSHSQISYAVFCLKKKK